MDPFIPERDGPMGKPAAPAAPKPQPKIKEPPPPKVKAESSGGASKLITIVLFAMCGLLLAMNLLQAGKLSNLQERFDDLSSKINSTDESLNQSGAALSIRIQKQADALKAQDDKINLHFSEIDKLWAARNKVNQGVSGVEKKVDDLARQLASYDAKIASGVQSAKDVEASMQAANAKLEGDLGTLRKDLLSLKLNIDALETQAAKTANLSNSVKQWQTTNNQRLANVEEAIRAIDSFRQHTNAELIKLRNAQGVTVPR